MYKLLFFLMLATVIARPLQVSAQRKKTMRPVQHQPSYKELMERYEFKQAAQLLETALKTAQSSAQKDSLTSMIRQAERANEMLSSTRRVIFVDSMLVDKDMLLSSLRLSKEAGRWVPTSSLFKAGTLSTESMGSVAFINSLNNTIFFSAAKKSESLRLYSCYSSNNQWNKPILLKDIDSTFLGVDFPFMLSDGVTLYFGAQGEESIGGYDIFVTRYNPETRKYVQPGNLGMPFNSPANDYLYAVDHNAGIGVFASDRRQPEGKVCIYTFIPSTEHYDSDTTPHNQHDLKAAAQIHSIIETQKGREGKVSSVLRQRNAALQMQVEENIQFRFIVNDDNVYTSLSSFRHPQARQLASRWIKLQEQYAMAFQRHETEQEEYARTRSQTLKASLRESETRLARLRHEMQTLEKQIRLFESTL